MSEPHEVARLDWACKGTDPGLEGCTPEALSALRRSLFDDALLFPVAVLRRSVVRANSAWMRKFLSLTGIKIAPHGKTTMAPELFRLQAGDGAWGFTAATVQHVRCYRKFGCARIILANPLVGTGAIAWVLNELKAHADFDFYCLVDSLENLQALARAAKRADIGRPLQVLIEVGCANGRGGVRTLEQGLTLARAVDGARPWIALAGVECFEGVVQLTSDGLAAASAMLDLAIGLAAACDAHGFFRQRVLLSAGGSGYFDLVAREFRSVRLSLPVETVIRSGCYLTHDDGLYARLYTAAKQRMPQFESVGYDLAPALQVWGQVLAVPEPGRVICGVGKRDVGYDVEMPKLVAWARVGDGAPRAMPGGYAVNVLNDQHAFIDGPREARFRVGDLLGFGISHPCTTFDKWRVLMFVDEDYRLDGFVKTYF